MDNTLMGIVLFFKIVDVDHVNGMASNLLYAYITSRVNLTLPYTMQIDIIAKI